MSQLHSVAGVEVELDRVLLREDKAVSGLELGRIDILVNRPLIQKLERRGLRFTALDP